MAMLFSNDCENMPHKKTANEQRILDTTHVHQTLVRTVSDIQSVDSVQTCGGLHMAATGQMKPCSCWHRRSESIQCQPLLLGGPPPRSVPDVGPQTLKSPRSAVRSSELHATVHLSVIVHLVSKLCGTSKSWQMNSKRHRTLYLWCGNYTAKFEIPTNLRIARQDIHTFYGQMRN